MSKIRILFIMIVISFSVTASADSFTVNVTQKGSLEAQLTAMADDMEKVTELIVVGELNDEDLDFLAIPTALESVDLSGAAFEQTIGMMFSGSMQTLKKVALPSSVKKIDFATFYCCSALAEVSMPGVEVLEMYAFMMCSALTTVTLPSSLAYANHPFYGCESLTTVNCQSIVPFTGDLFGGIGPELCTLYVPELAQKWYEDDNTEDFVSIVGIPMEVKEMYVHGDRTLTVLNGLDGIDVDFAAPRTDISSDSEMSALTVDASGTWNIGRFHMSADSYNSMDYVGENWNSLGTFYPSTNSLLNKSTQMIAQDVSVSIRDNCHGIGQWTFFCLPFDADMKDVNPGGNERWVIRRYDGENRAALMTGKTWVNVNPGERLNAYQGYILQREFDFYAHMSSDNYIEPEPFLFNAADTKNKQNIFSCGSVKVPLSECPAEMPHNSGWNLIGNPYPCYYNIGGIEGAWVLLVAGEWGYDVYTTMDDPDYTLMPFSAFFVQCPKGTNGITFQPSARVATKIYSNDYYDDDYDFIKSAAKATLTSQTDRRLFNILLSDGVLTDRTRLVVNPAASTAYELQRDASKMMSARDDVPQIFIVDNGLNMAIDECPIGNGMFALGMKIGKPGKHTIRINTKVDDCSVMLIDNLTGTVTDITKNSYEFESDAVLVTNRFCIKIDSATSIEDINESADQQDGKLYDLNGVRVSNGHNGIVIKNGRKELMKR